MSIQDRNVIDIVSIDENENVMLTITDHLEWDQENEHLLLLQDKINDYLSAIEGGDLFKKFPEAKGRNIVIRIASKYEPNEDGEIFLERVKILLMAAGYGFHLDQSHIADE